MKIFKMIYKVYNRKENITKSIYFKFEEVKKSKKKSISQNKILKVGITENRNKSKNVYLN